jgi:hypothetical protein
MTMPSYLAGTSATVTVSVTKDGQPVSGATIAATFFFAQQETCTGLTDQGGTGLCSVVIPKNTPDNQQIQVSVKVTAPNGAQAIAGTSFVVFTRPR